MMTAIHNFARVLIAVLMLLLCSSHASAMTCCSATPLVTAPFDLIARRTVREERLLAQLVEQPMSSANQEKTPEVEPRVRLISPGSQALFWSWHDRISWAASLVLVALGYFGVLLAHRGLKQVEESTKLAAEAAQAARESAIAAQATAKALSEFRRPWMVVSVEPITGTQNCFRIITTNRGLRPAGLISKLDRVGVVKNESYLPKIPEYSASQLSAPSNPVVLLPGESAVLQTFGHEDLRWICSAQDRLRSVLDGVDTIVLYGKVLYKDLASDNDTALHESNWCYSYVLNGSHGALVPSGPSSYRRHQ